MSAVTSERRRAPELPETPADPITLDESVTLALLAVLESMTPEQRVAVILHGVFGYSYAEVAAVTSRPPAACRQLASAARRIRVARIPVPPSASDAGIVGGFKRAWEAGDTDALVGLLHPAAIAIVGGAGLTSTALYPVEGDEQIAHYLVRLASAAPGLTIAESTVNGQPGLVAQRDGITVTVLAFDVEGHRVTRICACPR